MSRRESKNPVSGQGTLLRNLIVCTILLLFWSAITLLCLWSYASCDRASSLPDGPNAVWRIMGWFAAMFNTRLCGLDGELWTRFTETGWKVLLGSDLLLVLILLIAVRRFGHFHNVEYGSSHWATRKELKPFRIRHGKAKSGVFFRFRKRVRRLLRRPFTALYNAFGRKFPNARKRMHRIRKKLFPGKKVYMPLADGVYMTDAANPANRNVFVNGAPGSGKTFCVIIPAIEELTRGGSEKMSGSFFCTDTKGALFRDTYRMVTGRGCKTYLLNLSNPWFSDRYNPLENIHEDRKYTEINQIALAYAKNARDEEANVGDAIWEDTFRIMLVAAWCYQYDYKVNPLTGKPETRAMWRTAELIRSLFVDENGKLSRTGELSQIVECIRVKDRLHPTVENFDSIAAGAPETVASVVFTALSKINLFTYPEIQAMTDGNDIKIDEICENPCGVYLNFEVGSPYRAIAALFIEQLFSSAYYIAETKYDGRLPVNLAMYLDELPNICKVYSLPERLSTSRSYGIDIVVSVQSMQQLEKLFDKAEETLKNNCVTHIYLGSGEQKALKEISEALGKTTTEELSRSRNIGFKNGGGGSDSDKLLGRELVFPAEIHSMPDRYAIVKMQHHQPIFAEKFKTAKQDWYGELGGKGCPENNCKIEDAYRVAAVVRKARYYQQRLERVEQAHMTP